MHLAELHSKLLRYCGLAFKLKSKLNLQTVIILLCILLLHLILLHYGMGWFLVVNQKGKPNIGAL